MELPGKFEPKEIEARWIAYWKKRQTYAWDPNRPEKTLSSWTRRRRP